MATYREVELVGGDQDGKVMSVPYGMRVFTVAYPADNLSAVLAQEPGTAHDVLYVDYVQDLERPRRFVLDPKTWRSE